MKKYGLCIKCWTLLLTIGVYVGNIYAQSTTIINSSGNGGFETGTTFAANGWTVVNSPPAQTNQWYCGTGATGYTGARCAHIGTGAGNNNYNSISSSVVHFYRDVTFPVGQPNISFSFSWKGYGESFFDYVQIFLAPTATTPAAGVQLFGNELYSELDLQNTWQTLTINLPCSLAGTTQRLIFSWINDASVGTNPAGAIDNISLISSATTLPCATLVGTGFTSIPTLPYNSGPGTTCGMQDDITVANASAICGDPGYYYGEDFVWSFTPATSGNITISLNAPLGSYTALMLFNGCPVGGCGGNSVACVGFAQDYLGDKNLCLNVIAGTTYYLLLDAYYGCNAFNNLSITAPSAVVAGPTCSNPVVISSLPFVANGESTGCMGNDYSNASTGSCLSLYESGQDKVYKYVSPGNECIGISLLNASTTSAGMQVYFGCPGSGGVCIGNTGGGTNLSLSLNLTTAGTYYIITDTWNAPDAMTYNITVNSFGSGPANDLPCNATALNLSVLYNADNSCSGGAGEPPTPLCWWGGNINTVWFSCVCPSSGKLRVKTLTQSLTDTQLEIYTGGCNALTAVPNSCNDNTTLSCSGAMYSEVLLTGLTPGAIYYIRVDGAGNATGSFQIMAQDGDLPPPPTTQDCDGAIGVCQTTIVQPTSYFGCGSSNEIGNCPVVANPCINVNGTNSGCLLASPAELHSVWYLLNITTAGSLRWTCTQATSGFYDWALYDITGTSCAAIRNNLIAPVRCNWNSSSTSPTGMENPIPVLGVATNFEAPLNVSVGQTLVLILSNWSSTSGGFTLSFANSTCGIGNPATVTWTGTTNTNWSLASNWGECSPPVCGINANIAPSANQPVLTANQTVKSLTIMPGASMTINAGVTLTVCGDYTNYGTLTAAPTSTVLFNNGTVIHNLVGAMTAPNAFGNITITKTGGEVKTGADLDVKGNLTMNNNTSIFNSNGKYIRLGGNFNNASAGTTYTNSAPGGTLEFNGTAAQQFNPGGNFYLNNVRMNHTGPGVSLNGNMIVGASGILTLDNGIIITNANEAQVFNNASAACTPGKNTSYVQGNLRRYFNGAATSYDFPVGNSAKGYQRANITFTTATTIPHMLANFNTYPTLPSGPLSNECPNYNYNLLPVLDNGYWNLTAGANATSGIYNITLYNTNYTVAGTSWTVVKSATTPPTTLSWTLNGTCNGTSTINATKRNGMNGFSAFGVGVANNTPLPVKLISFVGVNIMHQNRLTWITASENNSDYFLLEKSVDGEHFIFAEKIKAKLFSSLPSTYTYTDIDPFEPATYYRLVQVDLNGEATLSEIIMLHNGDNTFCVTKIFPNPANGSLMISAISERDDDINIQFRDMVGRIVLETKGHCHKGNNSIRIDLTDVPKGVYMIAVGSLYNPSAKFFVRTVVVNHDM